MGLMIPLMAGLTPDDYDVTLCDERLEDTRLRRRMGPGRHDHHHRRVAARVSARPIEFRKKGIPVVFGGFHATLQTEEALKHADAVVQGEADLVWPAAFAGLARRQAQAHLQVRQASRSEEPAAPAP